MFRYTLMLLWGIAILLMTSTSGFRLTGDELSILFKWVPAPDLTGFLHTMPQLKGEFLFQKIGHVYIFFILTLLAPKIRNRWIFLFIGMFAFLTEFLQLFLSRGGRLYDVGFDLAGVVLALLLRFFMTVLFGRTPNEKVSDYHPIR